MCAENITVKKVHSKAHQLCRRRRVACLYGRATYFQFLFFSIRTTSIVPAGSQDSDLPLPVFIILESVLLSYIPKDIFLIDMFLEIYWVK